MYGNETENGTATTVNNTEPARSITAFQPLIDKVGVPLFWFGIGYLAATLIQRPRRAAA